MESKPQARDFRQTADRSLPESREHDLVIALTEEQLEGISGGMVMVQTY
jgi:hypothetical protein